MKDYTIQQLKDSMLELYSRTDELSCIAYRLAFDMLESKLSDEAFDQFLDAYGL